MARLLATVSRQPNRPQRQRAVDLDDDMADLAGAEAVAMEQLAAKDDAGADAAADLDRDEVRGDVGRKEELEARAAAWLSLATSTGTP